MKQFVRGLGLMLVLCGYAVAQDARNEVSVQGSGIFTRKTTDSGITYKPTSTGGFSAGYRFNINRWLEVEGDYDYFRNTQKYLTSTNSTFVKANVNAMTGTAVINIPNPFTEKLRGYAFVGGGALYFSPRDASLASSQAKDAIVIGGGDDVVLSKHILLRFQAKTFIYKAPDFGNVGLRSDKFVQSIVPSAGLVYSF